ncbi:MAG: DUF3789 domain-containing protein [Ruminococcus sp.]|nr:DUF3789 domain-containing protein [Ruminococcus sp.]
MLRFILGAMTGGTIGVVAMCLAQVASDADRYIEERRSDE